MSQRSNRSIPCLQYFVSPVHMGNDGRHKNQANARTKQSEAKKHKIIT